MTGAVLLFPAKRKTAAVLVRAPSPPEAPRSGHPQRLVTVLLAPGYGYGYGYGLMPHILLKLDNNEALAVADALEAKLEAVATSALELMKEGRSRDAMDTMRHFQRIERIRDNLSLLGRQHLIGW